MGKKQVFIHDFSPDGGESWFPLCDASGYRIWSTKPYLPAGATGWRGTTRPTVGTYNFDQDFPEGKDVWGTHSVREDQSCWRECREKIELRFTINQKGFSSLIVHDGHQYILRRHAVKAEKVWITIKDAVIWYRERLDWIEPLGPLSRDVSVIADGFHITTGQPMASELGSEFRLEEYLNAWMTNAGNSQWVGAS